MSVALGQQMMRIRLAFMAGAVLWAPGAFAAPAYDQTQILVAFVHSPLVQSRVAPEIEETEPEPLRAQCASLRVLDASRVVVVSPPLFIKQGANWTFDHGAFSLQVSVDRCGHSATRRLLFTRKDSASPMSMQRLTPGDFAGNFKLEIDSVKQLYPLVVATAHCGLAGPAFPIDTRTVSPLGPEGGTVLWFFWACGKPVQIFMTYTPMKRDGVLVGTNMIGGPAKLLTALP